VWDSTTPNLVVTLNDTFLTPSNREEINPTRYPQTVSLAVDAKFGLSKMLHFSDNLGSGPTAGKPAIAKQRVGRPQNHGASKDLDQD
jgi:hypothetical protein